MIRLLTRRSFLAASLAGLAAPLAAEAQQAGKVFRIGWLGNNPPVPSMAPVIAAFMDGLGQYGYVDGRNLRVEYRWAHGHAERYPELVRDLIQANVQLIVAAGTPAALVLKEQAKTMPVGTTRCEPSGRGRAGAESGATRWQHHWSQQSVG